MTFPKNTQRPHDLSQRPADMLSTLTGKLEVTPQLCQYQPRKGAKGRYNGV